MSSAKRPLPAWATPLAVGLVLGGVVWFVLSTGPDTTTPGEGDAVAEGQAAPAPDEPEVADLGEVFQPLPGEGPLAMELHFLGHLDEEPIRLVKGGSLEGRVRDPLGNGVREAKLVVEGGPQAGLFTWTDVDGRYRFPALLPGSLFVRIESGSLVVGRIQRVLAHATTRRDFVIGPSVPLDLLVTDHEGKPLAGAEVVVDLGAQRLSTGEDGIVRFAGVPKSPRVPLSVSADGHVPTRHELNLMPPPDSFEPVKLPSLQKGGRVRGQVKSWPGGPLPTVTVVPRTDRPGPQQAMWELWQDIEVDANGHFTIDGLPTSQSVDVRAFHPEGVSTPAVRTVRPGESVPATVQFVIQRDTKRIAGRVTDPAGQPVPGARVVLEAADPMSVLAAFYPGLDSGPASVRLPVPAPVRREVIVNRAGEFDFSYGDHPQGTGFLVLRAFRDGYTTAASNVKNARTTFRLVLRPEERDSSLLVKTRAAAQTLPPVEWFLDGERIEAFPEGVRADGPALAGLVAGRYEITARRGEKVLFYADDYRIEGRGELVIR